MNFLFEILSQMSAPLFRERTFFKIPSEKFYIGIIDFYDLK